MQNLCLSWFLHYWSKSSYPNIMKSYLSHHNSSNYSHTVTVGFFFNALMDGLRFLLNAETVFWKISEDIWNSCLKIKCKKNMKSAAESKITDKYDKKHNKNHELFILIIICFCFSAHLSSWKQVYIHKFQINELFVSFPFSADVHIFPHKIKHNFHSIIFKREPNQETSFISSAFAYPLTDFTIQGLHEAASKPEQTGCLCRLTQLGRHVKNLSL